MYLIVSFYVTEQQFLSDDNNSKPEDGEDDEEVGKFGGKSKKKEGNSLMEKLQTAVVTDEEKHKIDGKSTKTQKAEKKEFRKKLLDYVMEKLPGLQTRSQRAGLVHNFLRGLGLNALQGILSYDCKMPIVRMFLTGWLRMSDD